MNKRMTAKDRNVVKGAIRRAFARSELYRKVKNANIVDHLDPKRPRVKKWCRCNICNMPEAYSYVVVDHIIPVVPLDSALEFMDANTLIDRVWCEENNLQTCCKPCHNIKSRNENKLRRDFKKMRIK